MSNQLTNQLLFQIFSQESNDPFLTLVTLTHPSFSTTRFVNNSENIISRGETFLSFPMSIKLPPEDGETLREVTIEFDNVSLELITKLRSVSSPIDVKLELVLASMPDIVQMSFEELKINSASYNATKVSARLIMDSFLQTGMTSEKYEPSNFRGLF